MKRLFDELRENLDEFIAQNDYPALAIVGTVDELAYVGAFLRALDDRNPADFVLLFEQPFTGAVDYMEAIVQALRVQLDAAKSVRTERGDPPFPPLPPALDDRLLRPEERLRKLVEYARTLLPNETDHRLILALLPRTCADDHAYAKLVTSVLPTGAPPASLRAVRLVLHDARDGRPLAALIQSQRVDRVLVLELDLSTPSLTNALTLAAANTSLPVAERMPSLLQLAALDYAYRRYDDALAKYRTLYAYYDGQRIHAMSATCLFGAGDALRARGDRDAAKALLQSGIVLALRHRVLLPLLNGFLSLVELCFELGEFEEAEGYADSGAKVAAAVLNPIAHCDLLERRGDAQRATGKTAEAIASYEWCHRLSEKFRYRPCQKSAHGKLVALRGAS
jgi:hypothetical protein